MPTHTEFYFWTGARAAQQTDETDHAPGIPSAHDFQVPGRADYGQHEKVQPMLLHTLVSVLYHSGFGPFHQ